jgi:pimeloyl-ACP methyl ester carboxylesterase
MEKSGATTSIRIVQRAAHDGCALALDEFGDKSAQTPSLIWAHGFGQNRLHWRPAASDLAHVGWHSVSMDGRGHGDSGWSADGHYEMDQFVADLRVIAADSSLIGDANKPILIGASMGGLLGLLAEGEASSSIFSALVLVDVTPRWEAEGVNRILTFMQAYPDGFASIEAASAAVNEYLPHRENKDPQRLRTHLRDSADGRLRWHWDPRLMSVVADHGQQYIPRLISAAAKVKIPVLLLNGARSDVVSAKTIAEFQMLIPHATVQTIADATHLVVGDQHDQFSSAIENFLLGFATPQSHDTATLTATI